MHTHGDDAQHGKPATAEERELQRDAREGQARPGRVAERLVVPSKPGNAGGGKGPQFKVNVLSGPEPVDWHESSTHING